MASFSDQFYINRRSSLGVELYSFQFGHRRQSYGTTPKVCSFDCANCRKLMLNTITAINKNNSDFPIKSETVHQFNANVGDTPNQSMSNIYSFN